MEVLKSAIVLLLSAAGIYLLVRRGWKRWERRLVALSFAAHAVSGVVQMWLTIYYYGTGDSLGYFRRASIYANFLAEAPLYYLPRLIAFIFQQDVGRPFMFVGLTAGSMTGLTVFPVILTGRSLYATVLCFAILSLLGKLILYRTFRKNLPVAYHRRVAVAVLLLPSLVFWTSGIVKESVALTGLAIAFYGMSGLTTRKKWIVNTIWGVIGVVAVGLVKPYLLFPFGAASGVWFYWSAERARRGLRPIEFVLGAAIAVGGVLALGAIFPRYSVDHVATEAARLQQVGSVITGGSSYAIGDYTKRTLLGQLGFAPLALATSLFRPLLFEVNNVLALAAAIEIFAITLLLVRGLAFRRYGTLKHLFRSPIMMFSLTYVVVAGVAIGLATTNLGTLGRYRAPMLPFYLALVLYLLPVRRKRTRPASPRRRVPLKPGQAPSGRARRTGR